MLTAFGTPGRIVLLIDSSTLHSGVLHVSESGNGCLSTWVALWDRKEKDMDQVTNLPRDTAFLVNLNLAPGFTTTGALEIPKFAEPGDISFSLKNEDKLLSLDGNTESWFRSRYNTFLGSLLSSRPLTDMLNLPAASAGEPQPAAAPDRFAEDGTRMPRSSDKRPPGDNRSAEEILKDNPAIGKLKGKYEDGLKKHCGDWENEPDPQKRADAAYRASEVLKYIDSSASYKGGERNNKNGDGEIEGWNKKGKAVRHGTEAHLVQEFCEKGYDEGLRENHRLDQSNDRRVREDGSVKPAKWKRIVGKVADALSFIPVVSNTLHGITKGDSVWSCIKGGLRGYGEAVKDAAVGAGMAIAKGQINPVSIAMGAYKGAVMGTDLVQRNVPDKVKDVMNVI